MATDRAVQNHRITRSGTAHRVLRSELDDYDLKFKVSLPTLPLRKPEHRPDADSHLPLTPPDARIDGLLP
jgi:hypothetical protein